MEIVGFVSVGTLVIIQIVVFAYGYGRLSQKVNDTCKQLNDIQHRLQRLEDKVR